MANEKRRDFLKFSGVTAALLVSHSNLFAETDMPQIKGGNNDYPGTGATEAMYRNEFGLTRGRAQDTGYAYHCTDRQGDCAWEIWSQKGVVTRENQSARYPSVDANIPDPNPRGCNKGAQHSQVMYEKERILYPMQRAGKRGEGKWKRISWEEAATELAQKIFDVMTDPEKGPGKLMIHAGTALPAEGRGAAPVRLATLLGANMLHSSSYQGDMFSGAVVAYGEGRVGCTYDFIYGADTAIFWGANPSVSHISDAHYIWEGKYNGAKVIVITPEFNASAKSADLWIPIKPGSDNLLAASVIYEILSEKLYKPEFMKHFTDLPFLVVKETKKLLRRSDIEGVPKDESRERFDEQFYTLNRTAGKLALMPGTGGSDSKSLRLDELGIDPELEGEWPIKLHDGREVVVTTVFEMLKSSIEAYAPEETQELTGVHPDTVRALVKDIALPKVVSITAGAELNKYFNGLMSTWNIASICGLTGRLGPYGGLNTENEFRLSGLDTLSGFSGKYKPRFASGFVGEFVFGDGMKTFDKYFGDEDVKRAQNGIGKQEYMEIIETMLARGENAQANIESEEGNVAKPWWQPEVCLVAADSKLRRNKGPDYREAFLQKMAYFAYIDYRMSETAAYADLLLPAASDYEVWGVGASPGYQRFASLAEPAANLKPVGEAKDEWRIMALIAKKLEEIASKSENREKAKVKDEKYFAESGFHDLTTVYQEFTNTDRASEAEEEPYLGTDKLALEAALEKSEQYQPWTIEKMYKAGGFLQLNEKAGKSSPLYADRPYSTFENMLYKFQRFETLSGRQTFYVDHELYIKLGAQTNRGMEGIRPRDPEHYPFVVLTPHARWSIRSRYKTSKTLLRLQRGVPCMQVNSLVAEKMKINDGDRVRVFNTLGEFFVMAKVSSSCPPDSLVMEDGWEPYMFRYNRGPNEVVPVSLNLLEMADGWGHLKFGSVWDGNQYAYDGAVNIEKA